MPWTSLGKVTVTSAGTPVRFTTTRTGCHAILIQQISGNTGKLWVGSSSSLNKTTYADVLAVLAVPTANILPSANAGVPPAPNGLNLADYWLDADVSNEGALVSYLVI